MREIEFLEDLDNEWQWAIGAKSYNFTTKYYCECKSRISSPAQVIDFQIYEVEDPSECDPGCKLFTTREAGFVQIESNDGLITSTSAKGAPWADYNYDMEGSSHFQMRNDKNTKSNLKLLYDGEVDDFFEIE